MKEIPEKEKIDVLSDIQKSQNINTTDAYENLSNYPFYDKKCEKTVTFVSPVLKSEGIYKMIFPAMALNLYSTTHRAFIIGINSYNHRNLLQDNYDCLLPEMAIKESDWIVLPFLTENITEFIKELREINPEVKIAYCIDLNFLEVPTGYPGYQSYHGDANIERIIANIKAVDMVLTTNYFLDDYLYDQLSDELKGTGIQQKVMPMGFFPEITEPILRRPEIVNLHSEKLRIGIIGNPTHVNDFMGIKDQLNGIVQVYGNEIELISFGWRGGNYNDSINVFAGLPVTIEQPVSFYHYFKKLADLQFDLVIIPIDQDEAGFSKSSKNYSKFIELSALAVPCMITACEPYTGNVPALGGEVCSNNQNAILIQNPDDWVNEIGLIIENVRLLENPDIPTRLDIIANKAYQSAFARFDYKLLTPAIEKIFN